MDAEQWEHMVVRVRGVGDPIETFPANYADGISNATGGWSGLTGVLDYLGADGWQVIQVEGIDDNATTGRLWLKRRSKMKRVAKLISN
ncbi:MAG: hypothetical protein JWQ19_3962 [Subtercola sp.]|jgi:hypothetical protein|nr:hypothetical protein [Subtercola sp.]